MARRRLALSQNLLHSPGTARRLVRLAGVGPEDLVLEPGPGAGALTRELAARCGRVVAYELDEQFAARLPHRVAASNVRLVQGDFLDAPPPRQAFAVVGNLPFARTSAIVAWCLAAPHLTSATLLTQREFARKRTGGYGSWPRVTVESWPQYTWTMPATVARHHFHPVPRVDAGVLRLVRRPRPLLPAARLAAYRRLVAEGFTGVGGSLHATLARGRSPHRVRAAFRAARIDAGVPVGHVTPQQWLALFGALRS
ncbi:ErmE/ErmH/ErmO/ErmR family 23S rRNA (adenine(2058)-N(6))-methyltransferase [Streptomyces sulphureus]|uniref:ErmE/ErmH/ErmO/ErmR family 23S rRNA (adenine(2058)-N(6))-methyltransferase n=1 Tax=Streptomyces sulphureus TaxID=47758 RepID=UPI00036F8210|nr:ErmE/ErmH/ErmO/ErmR family 23S rRNA (adenine(2058)-N(6))-methyltransferase [Streptomyces sulphureus]